MTVWSPPDWKVSHLTPNRLYTARGFARTTADVAGLGLAAARSWSPPRPRRTGTAWVLVGGAGFLGARIVAQLLAGDDQAEVVVVSRRPEWLGAGLRTFTAAAAGLLADPRLRLITAGPGWIDAVPPCAVVLHLAAAMHALAGWDVLAPANLHTLADSVALARRDGALLQLASTLSVFVSSNQPHADVDGPLPTSDRLWLHGGYAQTKAAAEFALAAAGLPRAQVVRYGLLVPEPGRPFPHDHCAPIFARALDTIGAVPDRAEEAAVDLTPVAGAAEKAIRFARAGAPGWTHWANRRPATLAAMLAALEDAGRRHPVVAAAEWRVRVATLPPVPRTLLRAAFSKSCFLAEEAARGPLLNLDLFQATGRRFMPADAPAPPPPEALLPGVAASMLAPSR